MKCLKCSAEIEETMQVCRSCGLPLTSEAFKKAGLTQRTGWISFFSVLNYYFFGICSLLAIVTLIGGLTGDTPGKFFALFIVSALFAFVSFACAYGLWHLKSYGRTIQLVLAFIWLCGIPIGTILGILALAHFFKPEVKNFFTEPRLEELTQEEVMKIAVGAKRRPYLAIIIVVIFIFGVMIPGILAALIIPNAIVAIQKATQKTAMKDITVISAAIESYVIDNGTAPAQGGLGTYYEGSNFYVALTPFYVKILPIKDQWGNYFLVYCGTACNGKYGITGAASDDFIVVSCGRDGRVEDWEFDEDNPESGLFIVTKADDFNKDLVMWNGSWIRAPRVARIEQ